MKIILWILGAMAGGALAEELLGWVVPTCRLIVRGAAARLPREWQDRYAEEWEAELLALPGGPVTKVLWAARTGLGTRALNAALQHSRTPATPVAKQVIDRGLAFTMLLVAFPVLLLVALLVKVSSRGPVLFRQERLGRSGAPFEMLKFRSMYVGTELHEDELRAVLHGLRDPRVTPPLADSYGTSRWMNCRSLSTSYAVTCRWLAPGLRCLKKLPFTPHRTRGDS